MLIIVPPQSYLEVVDKLRYAGSFAEFYRLYITGFHGFCRGNDCLIMPTWNHLWFVAYLWIYTVVLYLAVRVLPRLIPWLRCLPIRTSPGWGSSRASSPNLCASASVSRARFPSTHALVGDWVQPRHVLWRVPVGLCLGRYGQLGETLERSRWITAGLAILGWAFLSADLGADREDAAHPAGCLCDGCHAHVWGTEAMAGHRRRGGLCAPSSDS